MTGNSCLGLKLADLGRFTPSGSHLTGSHQPGSHQSGSHQPGSHQPGSHKLAQVGSSWPQVGSSWPHVGSKMPQVGSSWPQVASSWPQVGSSWPQVGSRQPQGQFLRQVEAAWTSTNQGKPLVFQHFSTFLLCALSGLKLASS